VVGESTLSPEAFFPFRVRVPWRGSILVEESASGVPTAADGTTSQIKEISGAAGLSF